MLPEAASAIIVSETSPSNTCRLTGDDADGAISGIAGVFLKQLSRAIHSSLAQHISPCCASPAGSTHVLKSLQMTMGVLPSQMVISGP